MANKRFLVTGANGYIGTHVVNALLQHGCDVVACDLRFDALPSETQNLSQLNADIFDPTLDLYTLAGKPDGLIHLAWRNGFQHNAETHIQDLPGHVQFLERMMLAGVKNVTVMGTMHEIGYWEGSIRANTPTNPQSYYGIAKNTLRQCAQLMAEKQNVCLHWLRGYYIYGDDIKSKSVLAKILEADNRGQKTFPFTSGKNLCDYISVEELARQIAAAAIQTKYQGIINCCSGKPVSLGEIAQQFIETHGLHIALEYGKYPDRPYDSPAVWGDAGVIQKILEECEE